MLKTINIQAIRTDGGTQSRTSLNQETVKQYLDAINDLVDLPPITVFHDGSDYWLADGFHRYHAFLADGRASIQADVKVGKQRDAILHSCGANAAHGLPRTTADKRRAVSILLKDEEWSAFSDRMVGKICSVSNTFVGQVRRELEAAAKQTQEIRDFIAPTVNVDSCAPAPRVVKTANGKEMVIPARTAAPVAAQTPAPVEADHAEDANCDFDPIKLLEETQAENVRLQATVAACGADDKSAEIIKWRQIAEQAQRREQEHQAVITSREKELQKQARLWSRIGKAVGEEDPAKIAAAVERLALSAKQEAV